MDNNALDFELAKSVGAYFQLSHQQMNTIITEVKHAVSKWRELAVGIGIARAEQERMAGAFSL